MWELISNIATAIVVIQVLVLIVLVVTGLVPVLWRLGLGLSTRKIALFASGNSASMLMGLFEDSKLFRKNNFIGVTTVQEVGRAERATVFVIHWPDWQGNLEQILARMKDGKALVIYAPGGVGSIAPDQLERLNEHRNVVISNFRGRLLNDVVVSLITTSYEKG